MAIQNTSMSWRNLIAVLYLGLVAIQFTEVNRCYQCAATNPEPPCYQDANSSNGSNATNSKNCTTFVTKPSDSQPTNGTDTISTKPPTTPSTKPPVVSFPHRTPGAVLCYQCAHPTLDSGCYKDYMGFINTTRKTEDPDADIEGEPKYFKNCTDSNSRWDRCVIETHQVSDGRFTLFRRDCHDGKHFGNDTDDLEFHNLTPNNQTTCAQVKLKLVCFTFCTGDFCNGPKDVWDCDDYAKRNMTDEIPEDLVCRGNGVLVKNVTELISINMMVLLVVWQFKR